MKVLIVCALITAAAAAPGLLRVPKVYNAVITSNQNLSPSRAFPVIQPIIHRTAVGYVPSFYYTQITPHLAGSQVTHYPPLAAAAATAANSGKPSWAKDLVQASSFASSSRLVESTSFGIARERGKQDERGEKQEEDIARNGDSRKAPSSTTARKAERKVPLSFYPSRHPFRYEPSYVYTYNGFNPYLVPAGTYYVDYQPYSTVPPITVTTTSDHGADPELRPGLPASFPERAGSGKEKIPDVPPPPLPTNVPKRRS